MRVAGIRELSGAVGLFEVPDPRPLAEDEVLIAVMAAGVGNWDDIVRSGDWDVGIGTPMALGVEAAGVVTEVGANVAEFSVGDEVLCHPLPLRHQGTWAPWLTAPAATLALKPTAMTWAAAAALPVPALTAHQVVTESLALRAGDTVLVHGAGGVTGGLIVALSALSGATVIATSGPDKQARVRSLGATEVFDYHDPTWPDQARDVASGRWIQAAANAARGGAELAIRAVAGGGRLATITSDPPTPERGIRVSNVYVRPDGRQLARLAEMFGRGLMSLPVAGSYPLPAAGAALADVVAGRLSGAAVLTPNDAFVL